MTLADYYNDFFKFLLGIVTPFLPDRIKTDPAISTLLNTLPTYCRDDKKFVMVHYGLVKKMCSGDNGKRSVHNITELVSGSEEGDKKLLDSAREIKEAASKISEICANVLATPDADIVGNVEKFCLYVDILTKQFVPKKTK